MLIPLSPEDDDPEEHQGQAVGPNDDGDKPKPPPTPPPTDPPNSGSKMMPL